MPEGLSYRCRWEEVAGGVRVWVAARPRLAADAGTLNDALDKLTGVICDKTGDGEPSLVLFPLPPPEPWDAPWVVAGWTRLDADGFVQVERDGSDLFSEAWCRSCKEPRGSRTQARIRAAGPGERDVCSTGWGIKGLGYHPTLVSRQFLDLLTNEERASCEWREVEMPARCRKSYYECIPKRLIPGVAVRGWTLEAGECGLCGSRSLLASPRSPIGWNDNSIRTWVARSALDAAGSMCAIGSRSDYSLAVPTVRAAWLVEQRGSRGLRTDLFGAVPDEMIDPSPEFPKSTQRR